MMVAETLALADAVVSADGLVTVTGPFLMTLPEIGPDGEQIGEVTITALLAEATAPDGVRHGMATRLPDNADERLIAQARLMVEEAARRKAGIA